MSVHTHTSPVKSKREKERVTASFYFCFRSFVTKPLTAPLPASCIGVSVADSRASFTSDWYPCGIQHTCPRAASVRARARIRMSQ